MSWLIRRMQPDDSDLPIDQGCVVPWMRIQRVDLALVEIHGAGAERIAGAAGHAVGPLARFGVAGLHLLGRMPHRPFALGLDLRHARPGEALAADADAVADGGAVLEDEIEEVVVRIDDDRARLGVWMPGGMLTT